jgi:hypothetical protein
VGQLSSFSFQFGEGDQRHWVRVGLRLVPELYDDLRRWSISSLRNARIYSIREGDDALGMHPWHTSRSSDV